MRATKFEFENRFWLIGLIYSIGFSLYFVDHTNFGVGLLQLLAPSIGPDTARAAFYIRLLFTFAALLAFLAALLRTWATAYLRTEVVHDSSQHTGSIVADGPYRHTRNPLYLANLPMAAGVGFMASRLGWLFMLAANSLFCYRLIRREEDGLLQTQGESYKVFCRAVPRFWPSLFPRLPATGASPRWGQAIVGELLFWFFGLALLCFAITLNIKISSIVFALGFLFYFIVVQRLVKNRASQSTENLNSLK